MKTQLGILAYMNAIRDVLGLDPIPGFCLNLKLVCKNCERNLSVRTRPMICENCRDKALRTEKAAAARG